MSITEKQSMQEHDGLTDTARENVLRDLAEFVNHVQTSLANGTFHAALFTMMKDAEEKDEDGDPLVRICGYRHGFLEATDMLMDDTVERYATFRLLYGAEADDNAH